MPRTLLALVVLHLLLVGAFSGDEPDGMMASGTIYILRHGEKIATGNHLNKTGRLRALHVRRLFGGGRHGKYEPPRAIFANFRDQEYNSVELARPLARKLGLRVNYSFHRPGPAEMSGLGIEKINCELFNIFCLDLNNTETAVAMLKALQETGGPIMTVWESWNMIPLARDVGCDRPWMADYEGEKWGHEHHNTAFDGFLIMHFDQGNCTDIELKRQHFHAWRSWSHVLRKSHLLQVLGALLLLMLISMASALSWKRGLWGRSRKQEAGREPLMSNS